MNSSANLMPAPASSRPSAPEAAQHVPRPKRKRFSRFLLPLLSLSLVVGLALAYWFVWRNKKAEPYTGPLWTVGLEKLQLSIVERGTLESAENSEIVCRVKASAKGSTISTTIKWIVDDGIQVTKGQKLVDLDDSGLQEQLKDQNNKVNQAKASFIQSDEGYFIQESQNFSEIESAKTALVLAELDLKKFLGDRVAKGVFTLGDRTALQKFLIKDLNPLMKADHSFSKDDSVSEVLQTLSDIEGRIEIARSDREQWLDRASWSMRMVKKGYLSRSQADSDKARLESAEISLKKVQGELDIFRQFTVEQKVTELWGKIKESERALERTKTQAKSKEVQAQADRESKKAVFLQEESKKADIEEEIRRCVMISPQDGMVVYYIPESNRFSSSGQQPVVAQGEPVREGQKLMRIPNLNRMLVNTRVHEAMVSRVKGEITRSTGFSESIQAAMSLGRNPLALALNQVAYATDLKEVFRDKDLIIVFPGQKVLVRVDAYANKVYQGHVKSVATVASQADFFTTDVKVYQTMVAIDGYVENLRPGMSAEVTIIADETPEPVLTIPIQSVLGSVSMGANRKVYVLDSVDQPQLRDLTVGRNNDRMVEVLKGVAEKDRIVLNPRSLIGEKSDLKPGVVGKQRGIDIEEVKTKKGGKKAGPPPISVTPPTTPIIDAGPKGSAIPQGLPPGTKT